MFVEDMTRETVIAMPNIAQASGRKQGFLTATALKLKSDKFEACGDFVSEWHNKLVFLNKEQRKVAENHLQECPHRFQLVLRAIQSLIMFCDSILSGSTMTSSQ
jgi:hypothetical protein